MFTLLMLAVCGVAVMGLESVFVLHRDMNTKQSYMLFMPPNSCYKILGAKVLECGAAILIAGAFFFAASTPAVVWTTIIRLSNMPQSLIIFFLFLLSNITVPLLSMFPFL